MFGLGCQRSPAAPAPPVRVLVRDHPAPVPAPGRGDRRLWRRARRPYTFGNGAKKDYYNRRGGYQGTIAEKREAMGIDWMTAADINQAIPPAYTEYLGGFLMAAVNASQELAA
jgi:hypothetical protein